MSNYKGLYTLAEYQDTAAEFAIYKDPMYPVLGLAEEAGEVCGKFAKAVRVGEPIDRAVLCKELGDVLWNVAMIANEHGLALGEIALVNICKLKDRQQRNVIAGSGDNR